MGGDSKPLSFILNLLHLISRERLGTQSTFGLPAGSLSELLATEPRFPSQSCAQSP